MPGKYHTQFESPLGPLVVQGDRRFITGLYMSDHKGWDGLDPASEQSEFPFVEARRQLAEYFARERQDFDLPLKPSGTPFQQRVWAELMTIPYGQTITYAALADRVGRPTAFRAVGNANGRNPISILIPCHRVIGAGGGLTGYAGGLDKKRVLMQIEHSARAVEAEILKSSGSAAGSASRQRALFFA